MYQKNYDGVDFSQRSLGVAKKKVHRRKQSRKHSIQWQQWQQVWGVTWKVIALSLCLVGIWHLLEQQFRPLDSQPATAELTPVRRQFLDEVGPAAVKYGHQYNVLPSITIAQAILESDWGTSQLASQYHNLFGVKSDDPQNSQVLKTKEYRQGQWLEIDASFRVYPNFAASIEAHNQLLTQGTSWNTDQYQQVLQADNYVQAARSLQKAGYATDPNYAQKLINLIKKYQLDSYDRN
ncbi:glycoside hydrolase family 73 protein [Lactobacillus sp. DCY120]|uniref:Glycoside hydrolase family 73 protein n=1 Tax=Bombilactobacillus apium TaxID=2675299 RepID=A0A850RD71_9LACO|nr:glycoside hydrolase family 73 protein [Bombilactobacillus apium]NVY96708.1 glycoside hydrolase family 73 protein [Bombilactobacillus apium]